MKRDAGGTGTVPSENDMVWVTAKGCYVRLDPLERFSLVPEAIVWCDMMPVSQETVRPYTIVEGDNDETTIAGGDETSAVQIRVRVGVETAALNEDVDGES